MLAAAGLAFDVATLVYSGLIVFAVMAALWLYSWAKPTYVEVPVGLEPGVAEAGPLNLDSKGKAILALRKARDSAAIARAYKSDEKARKAYHEYQAALLSLKREFGFGTLKLTSKNGGSIPYSYFMECYVVYADRLLPLLREGHIDEAKKVAHDFKWHWGED